MKILELLTERKKTGNAGEKAAAKFLKKHGYKILTMNYEALGYEIDIIARNKEFTVYCEVKTRTLGHENEKEPRPASAVTPEKQRKIISAAKYYNANKNLSRKIRFDIIEVWVDEKNRPQSISHLEGAFNRQTSFGA